MATLIRTRASLDKGWRCAAHIYAEPHFLLFTNAPPPRLSPVPEIGSSFILRGIDTEK